jgi:CheY-like chemotaxis protein
MPGMDGLQLVGEIKQRFSDLPVMTVTAYGDEERLQQAAEYGAAEFLAKPVDCECLSARLPQLPSAWDAETGVDRMRLLASSDRSSDQGKGRLRGMTTHSRGQG